MTHFSKRHQFTLTPRKLAWPWVAFTPARTAFAVPCGPTTLAIRWADVPGDVRELELPSALATPTVAPSVSSTTSRQPGLHSLALHPDGRTAVGLGWHDGGAVAGIARVGQAPELVDLRSALGELGPMAATFSRDGTSLWLSAESERRAAILRMSFPRLELEARAPFSPAPPPAAHELLLHPTEDAVLLAMACGQDGTFLQVATMAGELLATVVTEGDGRTAPCGLAGTTDDGSRVCLMGAERAELRRWPDLLPVAELELPEALVGNYNGIHFENRFLLSAAEQEGDGQAQLVVLTEGLDLLEVAPALPGMWAGRLGRNQLVAVDREKAERRLGYVYQIGA